MRFFILEDNTVQSRFLIDIVDKHYRNCEIVPCNSVAEMDKLLDDSFDVYLLDVEVEDDNSIDYLEKVVKFYPDISSKIIFITAHRKYAMDALNKTHCFGYVEKPYDKFEIIKMIDSCTKYNDETQKPVSFFNFKIRGESHFIDKKNILFFEFKNKKPIMHMLSGDFDLPRMTVQQLLANLNDDGNAFIRSRRDTIVNINQIVMVKKQDSLSYVVFENDIAVPIGDKYKDDLFSRLRV